MANDTPFVVFETAGTNALAALIAGLKAGTAVVVVTGLACSDAL
jgi:hypothetical protein